MTGDAFPEFDALRESTKDSLLWLAHQLAQEVQSMIPLLADGLKPRGAHVVKKS